jgi:hypothetical protein
MMYMNVSAYVCLYYVNSRGKCYLSPKSQSLLDYVNWLEKLDQYGSAVSQKRLPDKDIQVKPTTSL